MPKDAIFAIASMTKPIFSVAAMTLYEEGRLLMNEPVGRCLLELADRKVAVNDDGSRTEPARRQPTIEDLMRHTSGFISRGRENTALHQRCPGGEGTAFWADPQEQLVIVWMTQTPGRCSAIPPTTHTEPPLPGDCRRQQRVQGAVGREAGAGGMSVSAACARPTSRRSWKLPAAIHPH